MRSSWDAVWVSVAQAVSRRSSCDRAQVGAVLVKDNRVVATGYNGPASGSTVDTSQGCSSWCLRAKDNRATPSTQYGFACPSIHAEVNALLYASRRDTEFSTMYVTHAHCADCAKIISNSGVARVVLLQAPEPHRPDPLPYLRACGIEVRILPLAV